ncbi:hypothetical protein AC578_3163 [Pseudocercospora eumusae]|uniref:Uncharacterized protein n=1 Tax=Pseudocercospora eumusae TaxID=321146 RepID=A0A139HE19_9PEZI|nr:hypothetical protein AC578_3163 [Pseudocercospora eumusae]KXT00630.1 hypothetical protein AC578_3163 [Pseudocercospora eumusae]
MPANVRIQEPLERKLEVEELKCTAQRPPALEGSKRSRANRRIAYDVAAPEAKFRQPQSSNITMFATISARASPIFEHIRAST